MAAAQAAHEAKKRKLKSGLGPDGKVLPTIIKPRKKMDRFDGLPEDEVAKRILPDHLGPNLDIVIVSYDLACWQERHDMDIACWQERHDMDETWT